MAIPSAVLQYRARLDLDLTWRVGFIEHRPDPSHGSGGYVPSSWLRVIDTPAADRLAFPLAPVSVPIPTIGYPSAPVLTSHAAVQEGNGTAEDLFLWRSDATCASPTATPRTRSSPG